MECSLATWNIFHGRLDHGNMSLCLTASTSPLLTYRTALQNIIVSICLLLEAFTRGWMGRNGKPPLSGYIGLFYKALALPHI